MLAAGSLTTCTRADAGAWFNYPFLTQKERDIETGLDYFGARYYSSTQGRFTSSDPVLIKEKRLLDPQTLSLYTYVRNNPQKYIDPTGEDLTIAVTNIVTGTSHINSRPGGAGTREDVNTYRMTITNESGTRRDFDVTRDTNYNGPAAQQRGLYGRDSEAPPGEYQGHIRRDGNKGFRIELYDPQVTQLGDRDTINAPDGTARGNIQIHIGPGCSEGCMLLTGGRRGRDAFETAVTNLTQEDQNNGHGNNINVNVQERNDPNRGDLPNGDRINVPQVNNNIIVVPVAPPPPPQPRRRPEEQ